MILGTSVIPVIDDGNGDVIGIGRIGSDVRLIPLKRYTLDYYSVIIQTSKS